MKLTSMVMAVAAAAVATATGASAGSVVELTKSNFEAEIAGKPAVVKFYAPWCGHCKALAPAWEQLAEEYNPKGNVVVAKVDCTTEEALCGTHQVSGYPTLLSFEPGKSKGEPYNLNRDLASLKKWVDGLKPPCKASNPKDCSAKEVEYINKMKSASKTELTDALARLEKMKDSSMAPALKQWVGERANILKDLIATA